MVEPADMSTSVAVVQSGQADISWAAEPQIVDGMKSGVWTDAFYQFTDLGDYAYSVLSVSQSTIRNDPETVQNFVNAMLKSLSAAQDKKTAVRAAGKEFPTTPTEDIEAAIDRAYKDGLWSVDGIITPEAVKNDMEVSIASDVYQGTYQYDELVDMQFVENAQKQN